MIKVEHLYKKYKTSNKQSINALEDINLVLPNKGLIFIVGKSGSGKSTLLHILGGLDSFDSGEITFFNKSSKNFKNRDFDSYRNNYVGFIFQDYSILSNMSVKENISLALELQNSQEYDKKIDDILEKVDMKDFKDRMPSQLSGGQKQRIAIARALIKNPKIILADEPTGALDNKTSIEVIKLLKNLSLDRLVVVVTHDPQLAETYADRIILINKGKIKADYSKIKKTNKEENNLVKLNEKLFLIENINKLDNSQIDFLKNEIKGEKSYLAFGEKIKLPSEIIQKEDFENKPIYFENTDKEKLNNEKDDEIYKSTSNHLSYKTKLKMGFSTLKHSYIRLIMTFLLSVLAFTLLGVVSSLTTYNVANSFEDSIKYYQPNSYNLVKKLYEEDKSPFDNINHSLSNEDYQNIKNNYNDLIKTYITPNIDLSQNLIDKDYDSKQSINIYNFDEIGKRIAVISNDYTKFNFSLTGSLPSTTDEIVISDFTFNLFNKAGVIFTDNSSIYPSSYSQIIGKSIKLTTDLSVKISGILNQNIDFNEIEAAYKSSLSDINSLSKEKLIKEYIQKGISNDIIVSESFVDKYLLNDPVLNFKSNMDINNPIESILIPSIDKNELKNIYEYSTKYYSTSSLETKDDNNNYSYKTYSIDSFITSSVLTSSYLSSLSNLTKIAMYVAIVSGLISVLITMNYLYTSIDFKKHDIGILKALGATSLDIFEIFSIEAILIATVNFIISIIASYFLTGIINNILMLLFNVPLVIINFSYIQIIILFVISYVISLLSCFIPSYTIANMKPVKAMKLDE